MSGDELWTFLFNTLAVLLIVQQLEDGILAPGLCIFGDNAYLNTPYMATPYQGASFGYEIRLTSIIHN